MRVAFSCSALRTHAVAGVAGGLDILFRDGRPEAWPARGGFKLGLRAEPHIPTARAAVDTRIVNIVMIAAECAVGACASSHRELPRCQFATCTRPRSSRLCRQ